MKVKSERKHNRKHIALLWVCGVFIFVVIAVLIHYRGVKAVKKYELGDTIKAADFTQRDAAFDPESEKLPIGWHVRILRIGGVPTPVLVHVVDTTAPTAEPLPQTVPLGTHPQPDAFVSTVKDADIVRVSYDSVPAFDTEWAGSIRIVLTDRTGNRNTVDVPVSVRATVESLTVEAGDDLPSPEQFLLPGVKGKPAEPIDPSVIHHVGTYPITFWVNNGVVSQTRLIVVDTVAPKAEETLLLISPGETTEANDFAVNTTDQTDVVCSYVTEPDYTSRDVQSVVVRLTDEGDNSVEIESKLLITGITPKTIEARDSILTPDDFDNRDMQSFTVEPFIPNRQGTYTVGVTIDGIPETMIVSVVDTTPPVLTAKNLSGQSLYACHNYRPEDLFEAEDISPVTMTYAKEPNLRKSGRQTFTVTARDASGNETIASRSVYLKSDKKSPHIYGALDRVCYVGETISYLADVYAMDDIDGTVEVTAESDVDTQKPGTYRVVYRAEDESGNKAKVTCRFTLIKRTITEEELHAVTRRIMEEITTPDMVDAEKLKAIFDYVQGRIVYTNGSNNNYTDWHKAAYDGYMNGKGDCFNIYALTRALLDETDIHYLSVERMKSSSWRTRHYWVMVNLGTGWYHFDPTRTQKHRVDCFMWTKEKCAYYDKYWLFDQSDYPAMAKTPFDYDAVVQMERDGLLP